MEVLDRLHRRTEQRQAQKALTAAGSPESGLSTIQAAKPEVIQRLEFVVNTLHRFVAENDQSGMMARFSYVTKAMLEEVTAELQERDEETLQGFMSQMGEVIAWIGHGDIDRLPDNLREFVNPRAQIERAS
jgi:hypothetical protein